MGDTYVNTTGTEIINYGSIIEPELFYSHTFSQSMLSTFQRCPEQARAEFYREVKSEPTDSTSLGTAVHAGIEYALYEQRDSACSASVDDMIDVGENELATIGKWKYTKLSKAKVHELLAVMLDAWHRDIYGSFEPELIEWKFRQLLYRGKHREVWLNGTVDCVTTQGVVVDWKTASRAYERWEKQRWAIQPTVYTWAYAEQFDPTDEQLPFRYGIMLHDGSTQLVDVTRDQRHVAWLRQLCSQVAWMIEHDLKPWPMLDGGWHCSPDWCGNWDNCKGAHLGVDWKS